MTRVGEGVDVVAPPRTIATHAADRNAATILAGKPVSPAIGAHVRRFAGIGPLLHFLDLPITHEVSALPEQFGHLVRRSVGWHTHRRGEQLDERRRLVRCEHRDGTAVVEPGRDCRRKQLLRLGQALAGGGDDGAEKRRHSLFLLEPVARLGIMEQEFGPQLTRDLTADPGLLATVHIVGH